MANEDTTGRKQGSEDPQAADTNNAYKQMTAGTTPAPGSSSSKKNRRNDRPVIGGTAVPSAKSQQPKQYTETSNPQQQQMESYNRMMRRRMDRMGYSEDEQRTKSVAEQRKRRATRLRERRAQQLAQVRRNLPGGKIDTSPRRVYFMIAGVAVAIIALIVIFVILRTTGVLH